MSKNNFANQRRSKATAKPASQGRWLAGDLSRPRPPSACSGLAPACSAPGSHRHLQPTHPAEFGSAPRQAPERLPPRLFPTWEVRIATPTPGDQGISVEDRNNGSGYELRGIPTHTPILQAWGRATCTREGEEQGWPSRWLSLSLSPWGPEVPRTGSRAMAGLLCSKGKDQNADQNPAGA
jgi:hypothetical protein